MKPPEVSIIIPAYYSHQTVHACLRSIEEQSFSDYEVILVDSSADEQTAELVRRHHPNVKFHQHPERLFPHQARNVGADLASGRILVFTDPDCTASPEWLGLIVAALHEGHEAVGGAVESEPDWWNRAIHRVKYPWWLPGGQPGPRPEIASANSSFSRELLESVGPYKGEYFAGDSELSWRVRERLGGSIWFEPRAVITHHHPMSFMGFVRDRLQRGSDFGRTRGGSRGWTRGRYLAHLAIAPLAPIWMTLRASSYAVKARHLGDWFFTLPVQILGNGCWCLGEAATHWRALWRR